MEFWGTEVKSGQPLDVHLGEGKVLHLSQACLGETKKETKDAVCLHITVEGKKLVLGTLHPERLPQQLFDLVFDKDFQISHNWKNGSVYLYGYKADQPIDEQESDDFDSEEEEEEEDELPVPVANGKPEEKKEVKPVLAGKKDVGKKKVEIVEPKDVKMDDKDSDEDDDSDAPFEDSDDSEDGSDDSSDDDDDEDDSDDEEETPTPKKEQSGKKRAHESSSKTPKSDKKAKIAVTPQKTEGKKGGAVHIATPHPSKKAEAKTPAGGSKSNQKSPATDGSHSCKPCNRNFKSEGALSSHNQAKHSASK